jgi:argonaute-like protein implicated in RNA metabolism and viral defense
MRIPSPLEIVEHHGDSSAASVCDEILALTKVNWNSCSFGSSMPITIRFAKNVGRILAELPLGVTPQTKYKFYM